MKAHELRLLSDVELKKRIQEELENLNNLMFQKVLRQLENPMKIHSVKRLIAQIKTILRERELGINLTNVSSTTPDASKTESV